MNRTYLSAETRRAVTIATVVDLAASCDSSAITTGQIAAAMSVSQGALFRHFPDKQSIWADVLGWTRAELNSRFDSIVEQRPLQRLQAMLAIHIAFVMDYPGVPRLLFGELQRAGQTPAKAIATQLMAGYRVRVGGELAAAQSSRQIAADLDIDAATVMFLALVQGLVMQALTADDFSAMPAMSCLLYTSRCV